MEQNKKSINNSHIQRIWTVGSGSSGLLFSDNLEDIYTFKEFPILEQNGNELQMKSISYDGMMSIGQDKEGKVYRWGECQINQNDKKKKDVILRPQLLQLSLKVQINQVSCGWHHAIFYNDQNIQQIYGYGSNNFGELGLGKANKQFISEPVQLNLCDQIIKQSDILIKNIHTGFRQTYVFLSNGDLYVTGQNKSFELGLPLKDIKIAYDFTKNEQFLRQNITKNNIQQIKTGYKFGCILTNENEVYGWGDNKYKQITDEDQKTIEGLKLIANQVKQFDLGWNHIIALLNQNDKLYIRGRNDMGQLGNKKNNQEQEDNKIYQNEIKINLSKDEQVLDIACGSECNYVLTNYGQVYAWGWNEHGNLGNNSLENVYEPQRIPIDENERQKKIYYSPNRIYAKGAICYIIQNNPKYI